MHDLLKFHACHGSAIILSENESVATRTGDFCNGCAFSSRPIKLGQKVCVELTQGIGSSGALRIGLTSRDPAKVKPATLPRYVCPNLTSQEGHWARALNEKYAESGNRVTFYVNSHGQMHYFINKEHKGVLLNHLPTNKPLWVLFDIYGNTSSAKFVLPDEVPTEILARGPEAQRAFHTACESGTQPVFRTRLMLVGQDRVGKTSLKKALIGLRYDQLEVSTDGIDLSASCSFNLRDRKVWKLALQGDHPCQIQEEEDIGSLSVFGAVDSLEEEYHYAIATNIVQELLHIRKQQQKEEIETESETKGNASGVPSVPCSQHSASTKSIMKSSDELITQMSRGTSASSTTSTLTTAGLRDHTLLQEVPDRVVRLVTDLIKKSDMEEARSRVGSPSSTDLRDSQSGRNITLNIWDFAGQAVYYTTHQVFLSPRAVYVMVFNLCSDLDEFTKVPLRTPRPGDTQLEYVTCELSHLDYMDFWMNSVHAHAAQNTRDSIDNTTLSPPIFIVGTHRAGLDDDPVQQEKLVEQKFDRIRQYILGKPYERHIVSTFYAVENSLSQEQDDEMLRLRRHIEEVSSKEPYMGEQMPIKWLRFEQLITHLVDSGTYFSSMNQIREVAQEAGISSDTEFETILGFYHDLGVIVHYGKTGTLDTTLRNTVILRPQWLIDMFKKVITTKELDPKWRSVKDLWQKLESKGILEERLLDCVWADAMPQKSALLSLMEKFDLIAECLPSKSQCNMLEKSGCRSFFVPCRLQTERIDFTHLFASSQLDVIFYFDFNGFLPDGLFHRVLTRCLRWSQECGGHDPKLCYRQARFFLDSEHDFILEMAPIRLARIKVTVIRLVDMEESEESNSDCEDHPLPPPRPAVAAKVRNFLESTLSDLREMWMKRISYRACVQCSCDKECSEHKKPKCTQEGCLHFLSLDECVSNKVVCCDHRRIKTAHYRKWFPTSTPPVTQGPILSSSMIINHTKNQKSPARADDSDMNLPSWVRSAAKLLNGGSDGQDWLALAKRLDYKKNKLDKFSDEMNPGLSLITDWIISSGNTSLSMDILVTYLEQMQRDDIVDIIQKGQESDVEPPQVFISYQWDCQDEVNSLRDRIEKAGYTCWMDIGQMGGGDQLYSRIDEGLRNSKVVIACLSPKYVVSHLCNKELNLADLLRKPIIPVMYEKVPWPPPGGMSLMFSQLVYINMKGVGGHGGSGVHADTESKYQEIIQRVSAHATAKPRPQVDLSPCSGTLKKSVSFVSERSLPPDYNASGAGEPVISYASDGSVSIPTMFSSSREVPSQAFAQAMAHQDRNLLQNNQVERVHVTKCAVCSIL